MAALRSHSRGRVVLSLTPLIDVVFILLVFFMLASEFAEWRRIELVPQAASPAASSTDPALILAFGAGGGVSVAGGEPMAIADAATRAAARAGTGGVLVRPASTTPTQALVDLVEALAAAGATGVRIETERRGEP